MQHVDITNLIVVAIAIVVAAGIPALLPRVPVSRVVLEILIGAIVGPQVLGWVHPALTAKFLANFGLGMLFLMAGFEMDPKVLRGAPLKNATAGWLLSAALALAASAALIGTGLAAGLVLTALALSTTAGSVLTPMLRDGGLLRPPYGPMADAASEMGEAAPVIALTLVLAHGRAPLQSFIMLAFAAAAFGAVIVAARAREGYVARLVEGTMHSTGQLPMRLAIAILILLAVLSLKLDIDMVVGAFVAGAIVRAALGEGHRERMAERLDGVGSAFLVPIYFITSGTQLNIAALTSHPVILAMMLLYAALMLVVRGIPAILLYRATLTKGQRIALAFHLGTQISLVVPITGIAVQRGLMSGAQGTAMVGGAILTTLFFPALARHYLEAGESMGRGRE